MVRSANRFHQVLAVDAIEVRRVVVIPDAHVVDLQPLGHAVDRLRGLLQQIGRRVHRLRQRTDDQVAVPDCLIELDAARELVALQLLERVVEAARLQPGPVQVRAPLFTRRVECVFEFDGLVSHGCERFQRARNVAGQLLAHAPELRADRDAFPASGPGPQRGSEECEGCSSAAEPEDVATGRLCRGHDCVLFESNVGVTRASARKQTEHSAGRCVRRGGGMNTPLGSPMSCFTGRS